MTETALPAELNTPRNRAALDFLEKRSAHSDLSDELKKACRKLGDVSIYCPDWAAYRYVAAHTANTLFTFIYGMNTMAFRLSTVDFDKALASGGAQIPGLDGWVCFELFRSDWPAVDTRFWATQAYVAARDAEISADA